MHKRIITRGLTALLCCAMLLAGALPASAEEELPLISEAAILMDADSGQILYEKNMHQRMYPASITKVMTGMLALKELEPRTMLTVSQTAVDAVPRTSSHIALEPEEMLTVDQALYALSMESANDAANVLAEAVSGDLEAFARRMTEEAHELGALDTNFANANGLPDENHYTTAYDMALIAAAAMKTPGFNKYFSTVNHSCTTINKYHSTRTFENRNQMLSGPYYYEGVVMAKTGWTSAALGTLVTAVRQGETTLIAVMLRSPLLEDKYKDAWVLMDYGFTRYALEEVTGEEMAAGLALDGFAPAAQQNFSYLLPAGTNPGELTFTLENGADLQNSGVRQTEVTVIASLGDRTLPAKTLQLIRSKPIEVTEPETIPTVQEPEAFNPGPIIAFTVLILSSTALLVWFKRKDPRLAPVITRLRNLLKTPAPKE